MNALVSVWDKTGLTEFAEGLVGLGWTIYATEGTARYLESKGIPVRRLSELTGLEESEKIKTLHPAVFERIYSGFFKIVVVNLYELKDVEGLDVGGVALLRASVKSYKNVLPVCRPELYGEVLNRLKADGIEEDFRLRLAAEAMRYVIDYDRRILEKLEKKIRNI